MSPTIKPHSRMREIRVQRGLTVAQLAELVGVGSKYISFWERWQAVPTSEHLVKIAYILDADPAELLDVSTAPIWEPLKARDSKKKLGRPFGPAKQLVCPACGTERRGEVCGCWGLVGG